MPNAEAATAVADAPKKFKYPELPKAKDPAFTFHCVYLEGYRGPTPAIPQFVEEAPLADIERPWEDLGFTIPSNKAEQHLLENRTPKLRRKENGAPDLERTRRWQHAFEKSRRYYEDPSHAKKAVMPRVIGVTLYCPLNEAVGPNGTLEDHGPYAAVGSESVNGVPMATDPGVCPRCETEEQRHKALREIANIYRTNNIPLPAPLSAAISTLGGK